MKPFTGPHLAALTLAIALVGGLSGVAHADTTHDLYSIMIPYASDEDIRKVSDLFDHFRLDADQRVIFAEVDGDMVEQLKQAGLVVQVDEGETARIREFMASRYKAAEAAASNTQKSFDTLTPSSITNGKHACYRTVEQSFATGEALARTYPNLVQFKSVGKTWVQQQTMSFRNLLVKYLPAAVLREYNLDAFPGEAGNDLKVLVVGNLAKQNDKTPRMAATGSIHAREYQPAELLLRYAEWLLANYGKDPQATWLVDNNQFHFILHANPAGRKMAEQAAPSSGAGWRKNVNFDTAFCAAHAQSSGVDLNRNFPFGWSAKGSGGSDGRACGETFRGAAAASEPETQAIIKYIAGELKNGRYLGGVLPDARPVKDWSAPAPDDYSGLYFDLHSFSRAILWPWGITRPENNNTTHTPNNKSMAVLAQRLAWYNTYSPQQVLSYNVEGTTTDTFYGLLGAPSYTIELGTSFYEPCDKFEKTTYPQNFNAMLYASRILKAPYKLPFGPDTADVKVGAASVEQGMKVKITALIDDSRYKYSKAGQSHVAPPPLPYELNIKAAHAFVDKLPWDVGAQPITLTATSGAFDTTRTLSVAGEIDTSKLAPGRHLIYVRGVNAGSITQNGATEAVSYEGPPSAVFIDVTAKPSVNGGSSGGSSGGSGSSSGAGSGGGGGAVDPGIAALFALLGLLGLGGRTIRREKECRVRRQLESVQRMKRRFASSSNDDRLPPA